MILDKECSLGDRSKVQSTTSASARVCLVLLSWRAGPICIHHQIVDSSPVQTQYVMQGIGGHRSMVEDASCMGLT